MGFFSSFFGKRSGHSGSVYSGANAGNAVNADRRSGWHDKVDTSDPDDRDCRKNMMKVRARVERVMNEEWCSRDGAYEIRREIGAYDMRWPEMEEIKKLPGVSVFPREVLRPWAFPEWAACGHGFVSVQ